MPLFLPRLKGPDATTALPSCLDMELHLPVEFRALKNYEEMLSNEFGKKAVARNQEILQITLKRDYV